MSEAEEGFAKILDEVGLQNGQNGLALGGLEELDVDG